MDEGRDEMYYEGFRGEIYSAAIKMGGTITGEHGVGKVRINSLVEYVGEKELEVMKKIKFVFDPNLILNPGAVMPT